MEVTVLTWIVGVAGLLIMGLLAALQLVAVVNPRGEWTIENVYGGDPRSTDPKAFFAVYQGYAWADTFFWGPIQITGSIFKPYNIIDVRQLFNSVGQHIACCTTGHIIKDLRYIYAFSYFFVM